MTSRRTLLAAGAGLLALAPGGGAYLLGPGGGPPPISAARLDDYVFVPSRAAAEVTLIDTRSDEVAGTLPLPSQPDDLVVSDSLGHVVYSSVTGSEIVIYDIEAQAAERRIALPFPPREIVMDPAGYMLAAADGESGRVALVALRDGALHGVIEGTGAPDDLTFSSDSAQLFISDETTSTIRVIDVALKKEIMEIPMSLAGDDGVSAAALSAVTRTPNGRYGVCVSEEDARMSVVNFADGSEMKTLDLGSRPSRPYTTADGQLMLVASQGDRTISLIDTQRFEIAAELPGVSDVSGINTGFFETVGFVNSASENKAVVLDLMTKKRIGEIPLDSRPGPGVVTADGLRYYVALSGTDSLAVIDIEDAKLVKTLSGVGHEPWGATMAQTNNYCH